MYGVMLIVVLMITGGAIAFIGDRLGTKIGKKRLSIFGLRPRHTSIVITIITGICITALTFGILSAASENVRTALFGMEKLNQSMRDTQAKLDATTGELLRAQEEQVQSSKDLASTQGKLDELQKQQKTLEDEAQKLQEGNRQLELSNQELASRNGMLMATNEQLGSQNAELSGQNAHLTETNGQLATDNQDLEQRNEALRTGMQIMREGSIAFRAGEVIASGIIRGNRDAEEVKSDLGALVQRADRNAAQRLGTAGQPMGIWLYPPEYNEAVEAIADSPQDMVVRIVAAGNLVRGEPIRTSLELHPNRVIYQKNDFITARAYKITNQSEKTSEEIVMDFLKHVNAVASAKGILPDPISGSIGEMDGTQFYEIVQAVNAAHGNIILSAYAMGDTDALGPLRLNVRLEVEK